MIEDEDLELRLKDGYRLSEKDMLIYKQRKEKLYLYACYQECIFNRINLINLNFNKAKVLLNSSPSEQDTIKLKDGEQKVYEFDDYCLQVWVKNNKIVTVIVSSEEES